MKAAAIEWEVPGWELDDSAPGASAGIIAGVSRKDDASFRIGARKVPDGISTFGRLHCLSVGGDTNVLVVPDRFGCVGLSRREAIVDAFKTFAAQQRAGGAS